MGYISGFVVSHKYSVSTERHTVSNKVDVILKFLKGMLHVRHES